MANCVTGKKMYPTQELAEDALVEAWTRYHYKNGNGPIAIYLCEDCKSYHFTSKGSMNGRLSQHLSNGKIALQQEANRWMEKMKKR